jgi:hypothetical protein
MADPTGTLGKGPPPDDLTLIYQGGDNFMARMKQLVDATQRHHEALARLQIGQDAKAALDQAQRKLADADVLQKQAAKTLADAEAKAKAQMAKADQTVADANAMQREADKRLSQVQAREATAEAAIAKADRAKAEADRVRNELQAKIDLLRNRVREIAAA